MRRRQRPLSLDVFGYDAAVEASLLDFFRDELPKWQQYLTRSIGGDEQRARRILVESAPDGMASLFDALLPKLPRGRPRLNKNPFARRLLLIHETKKSQEPEMTDTDFCRWYLESLGKKVDSNSIRFMRERLRRARKAHLASK